MAKTKTTKAADAVAAARENDYVQRLLDDPDLRDTLRDAYDSARSAYDRVASNGSPVKAVQTDKKLHQDLKTAAENLRDAADAIRGEKKKKKSGGGLGKLVLLVLITGGVALALSEGARKSVMDALFGAEEEFEYTSTTSNAG